MAGVEEQDDFKEVQDEQEPDCEEFNSSGDEEKIYTEAFVIQLTNQSTRLHQRLETTSIHLSQQQLKRLKISILWELLRGEIL